MVTPLEIGGLYYFKNRSNNEMVFEVTGELEIFGFRHTQKALILAGSNFDNTGIGYYELNHANKAYEVIKKIPVTDLPLYIWMQYKDPKFETLLKGITP